jgi:hypothetical protein
MTMSTEKLHLLWTTDNRDTVFSMLFMYARNAKIKGWWNDVGVIIWGASAKLAGNDPEVRAGILELMNAGVHLEACKACCDLFGVSETLAMLGVDVRYMGESLTQYLKSGDQILTI